ncbi:MAG TPA: MFS transporter [Methylomusa anaerophila]|uniref:Fosmidomycin resistance protein n=1 Tax=Methylomusa anaerophila TaxID=1930071 RepID=A0A348AHR5_9FIRM|nr:MFS transporter [Methylomusa anaerophila]BBB90613.1 fosmidomycin resistance protein [Methylomusa anaerophila]HML88780.1 MFS transporter [Methylomusa anaerophila]
MVNNTVGKSAWYNVSVLTAAHFMSDFYAVFLPPLLPFLMTKLGMSLTMSGILVMVNSVVSSVFQPVCGYYIDKSGYSWLLIFTLPVSAVFICVAGLVESQAALFAVVVLSGLAITIFHPLGSSLVGRVTPETGKGRAMSVFIFGGNVGCAVSPAVVVWLLADYGAGSLLWLIVPGLIVTWLCYQAGLHQVAVASPSLEISSAPCSSRPWYKSGSLLLLNAVMALRSWAQIVISTFLPVMLIQLGYPAAISGSMLFVFMFAAAIGGVIGGHIGDKFGGKNCIVWLLLISLPAAYWFFQTREITWLSWVALAVAGAALQGVLPPSIVWAQELLPDNAAMASGMMLGLSFGLGGIGAAITGALADHAGVQPALMWTLISVILALLLAAVIPDPRRQSAAIRQEAGSL